MGHRSEIYYRRYHAAWSQRHSQGDEITERQRREINHFCSPQREEYHDGLVHRQEKIGKEEHLRVTNMHD